MAVSALYASKHDLAGTQRGRKVFGGSWELSADDRRVRFFGADGFIVDNPAAAMEALED
jgi:hypothetical protein